MNCLACKFYKYGKCGVNYTIETENGLPKENYICDYFSKSEDYSKSEKRIKFSELMKHCEQIEGKCSQCDKRLYCEDFCLYTENATPRVLKQIIENDIELVEEKESTIHKWKCEQNEQ